MSDGVRIMRLMKQWSVPGMDPAYTIAIHWSEGSYFADVFPPAGEGPSFDVSVDAEGEPLTTMDALMLATADVVDWEATDDRTIAEAHFASSLDFAARQHHDQNEIMVAAVIERALAA